MERSPAESAAALSPYRAFVHYWVVSVIITVMALGAGVVVASRGPVTYTAEARVSVGYGDLSAGAITGFATASTTLASNYARYVNDRGLTGQGFSNATVSASPIPGSSVIRIEGVSDDRDDARSAVVDTANELINAVNNPSGIANPEDLLEQYREAAATAASAQSALTEATADLERARANDAPADRLSSLRTTVVQAQTASSVADLEETSLQNRYLLSTGSSEAADLQLVNDGAITGDNSQSRLQRFGLLGFVAGLVLALVVTSFLARVRARGRRRRVQSTPTGPVD